MNQLSFRGNWVDLAIVIFIIFYVWEGWGKGFIALTLELLSFIGAFIIALKAYPLPAELLTNNFAFPRGLANAVSFFVVGVVAEQLFSTLSDLVLEKSKSAWQRHILNRILGILPLFANAVVIVAFVVTLGLGLPIPAFLKSTLASSVFSTAIAIRTQALEQQLSGIFGQALSETFHFVTVGPIDERESVKLHFSQQGGVVDPASEQEMLILVNQARQDLKLPLLMEDEKLRDLARNYARDMLTRGFFSHYNPEGESPFDRMAKVGISYTTAGENLAFAPNVTIVHQGLMESQGHRENILNPTFGKIGIGVVDGGIYGKMFVQEFMN